MAEVDVFGRRGDRIANGAALASSGQHRMLPSDMCTPRSARNRRTDRPSRRRRDSTAALPRLRRDGRRTGRLVPPVVGEHHVFCAAVVRRLRRAVCPSDGQDTLCGACASERRSWDRVRAVLRYDRHSRHLVLGLKHSDRTHLAGRSGAGCTAPEAKSSPMPTFLCRCHCIGPGSFGVATTRRRCRPCRSARPECPRSRPTGWFGGGAHRYKAVSGRRRGRAMSAAPSRSGPAGVSPGSGWLLSTM